MKRQQFSDNDSQWQRMLYKPGKLQFVKIHPAMQLFSNPWVLVRVGKNGDLLSRFAAEIMRYLTNRGLQLLQSVRSSVRIPFAALNITSSLSSLELI